jgi:hypothetical protein
MRTLGAILLFFMAPSLGFAASGQDASSAALRLLDKQTNRISRFVVDINTPATQTPFTLSVGRCVKNVAGVPGQDAAWLDVTPKQGGDKWFNGWMFNTYPDVATLDNPRYDLQLIGCDVSAEDKAPTLLPEIKVDNTEVDDEAPAAARTAQEGDSATTGSTNAGPDPYYVPGLEGGNGTETVVTTPAPQPEPKAEPVDNSIESEAGTGEATPSQNELHRMMEGM